MSNTLLNTVIPTRLVGPIKTIINHSCEMIDAPLATFETPLWFSVSRGARVARETNGINTIVLIDCMTRSIILEAKNAEIASVVKLKIESKKMLLKKIVSKTSAIIVLQDWQLNIVGNLLYFRFSFNVGEASGHNMATKASHALVEWILHEHPYLNYVSLSGNFCTDKKVSAVNSILGRGKYAIAEIIIPEKTCIEKLHVTPSQLVNLHIKKNLIGSIIAGSTCSANAHFANVLLAFYLATGQDAANIIEGSQGLVHAELHDKNLYFSVTIPNIIVGVIGAGKNLNFAKKNLELLNCLKKNKIENAKRLASIIAATVLCGELSLLAALVNKDELIKTHLRLERKQIINIL